MKSILKVSILVLLQACLASDMLRFKLYDSTGELNEVKNGLYVHADVSVVNGSEITTPADPFLLCTSCTISYIFGVLPEYTA